VLVTRLQVLCIIIFYLRLLLVFEKVNYSLTKNNCTEKYDCSTSKPLKNILDVNFLEMREKKATN